MCRLGGSKRADHAVLRDVAGDEAQTWSALLMQRSLHSRTALLCAASPGTGPQGLYPISRYIIKEKTTSAGFDVVTSLSIILYKTMHEMSEPE